MDGGMEILAWDSAHFGLTVGRAQVRQWGAGTAQDLRCAKRRQGIDLCYVMADEPLPTGEDDFHLVDERLTWARDLHPGEPPPGGPLRDVLGTPLTPGLRSLAIACGWRSRFRSDERIPPSLVDSLYEIWMQRCLAGDLADHVMVWSEEEDPAGLVAVASRTPVARIILVGVAGPSRGRGIGTALLAQAAHRAVASGSRRVEVVTQAENQPACRLYSRSGLSVTERTWIYHLW